MRHSSISGRWTTAQLLRSMEDTHLGLGLSELQSGSSSERHPGMELPYEEDSFRAASSRRLRSFRGMTEVLRARSNFASAAAAAEDDEDAAAAMGDDDVGAAAATATADMDIFHDCLELEEENASFFDDLGMGAAAETLPTGLATTSTTTTAAVAAGAAASATAISRNERAATSFVLQHHEPSSQAAYSSGNGSRGSSCKRKSCSSMPNPAHAHAHAHAHANLGNSLHSEGDGGVEFSNARQLLLGSPSSSSGPSSRFAPPEGPRPQKTRISADSPLDLPSFLRHHHHSEAAINNSGSSSHSFFAATNARGEQLEEPFPRSVRRTFQPSSGQDAAAAAAAATARPHRMDFSFRNPDAYPAGYNIGSLHQQHRVGGIAAAENPSIAFLRSVRSPRILPGGAMAAAAAAAAGIPRRMSRGGSRGGLGTTTPGSSSSSSSTSPSSVPSPHQRDGESRVRSIRINSFLRRGGNYHHHLSGGAAAAAAAAGVPAGNRQSILAEATGLARQQGPGYGGRAAAAAGFSRPSPPEGVSAAAGAPLAFSHVPPTVDPADVRFPSALFEGAGSSRGFRAPVLPRELAAAEGFLAAHDVEWERHRPRLMAGGLAEILRALERVERDEDLTREQLLMLEATTFLFGGIGIHDDHNDWRLDIDNMSYEELLALGDRIGTVSTGVSEECIAQKMKRSLYRSAAAGRSLEDHDIKCCVCQEEYKMGEDVGTIDCGHSYHSACIRQWLVRKNTCPICKATALC